MLRERRPQPTAQELAQAQAFREWLAAHHSPRVTASVYRSSCSLCRDPCDGETCQRCNAHLITTGGCL